MSQPMELTEFFAMEAGEYLERLDALVSPSEAPNASDVVRTARALRGSALMAKQQGIAGTTAALENLARAVEDGRRSWSPVTRQLMTRAIDDLKVFVRGVATWSEEDEAKANALAEELDTHAGRSSAAHRAPAEPGLDSGTRAFVGREGAAVASALDGAAKALQQNPVGYEPLHRARELMKPLRGLASLAELPPLPDLLEGVDHAIREITSRSEPLDDVALLFNDAARALSRAAQEVSTVGKPDPDTPEARDFATRLSHALGFDLEVVPVEALFFDDNGPHVVKQGTRPNRPDELGRLELVAHGEHLKQAAIELERSESQTLQALRAQALGGTFRALSDTGGGELHEAVARFACAASDALGRGALAANADDFVSGLRRAADTLVSVERGNEPKLAGQLSGVITQFQNMKGRSRLMEAVEATHAPYSRPAAVSAAAPQVRTTPPAAVPPEPTPTAVAPPEPPPVVAAPEPAPVVATPEPAPLPVEPELATTAEALQAPATTDEAAPESNDLAGSWVRYQRLVETHGTADPDLDALVSGTQPAYTAAATPEVPATRAEPEADIVDVDSIQYVGTAAIDRAKTLRDQIRQHLAGGSPDTALLDSLIEELTDLVELARRDPE